MNADFLRPANFKGQAINGAYREKDDSGGSEYCEDYEEEHGQEQGQKKKNKKLATIKARARQRQYTAANQLNALIAGR